MRSLSLVMLLAGSLWADLTIDASRYPTLQAAIDAAPEHGIVQIPAGVYTGTVTIVNNHRLKAGGVWIGRLKVG